MPNGRFSPKASLALAKLELQATLHSLPGSRPKLESYRQKSADVIGSSFLQSTRRLQARLTRLQQAFTE